MRSPLRDIRQGNPLGCFPESLFSGGDVVLRDDSANYPVYELDTRVPLDGESSNHTSPYWPRPPDCFLCFPCARAVFFIVSLYGTFGCGSQVHLVAFLDLREHYVEVHVSHSRKDSVVSLRVLDERKRLVFLEGLGDRSAELVFVSALWAAPRRCRRASGTVSGGISALRPWFRAYLRLSCFQASEWQLCRRG